MNYLEIPKAVTLSTIILLRCIISYKNYLNKTFIDLIGGNFFFI